MKFLSLFFSFFILINPSFFVEGKNFSGYVFERNHFVFMSIDNQNERYTPTPRYRANPFAWFLKHYVAFDSKESFYYF
jgi:hypothetical protein